jgi:hypothetical protein
MGALSSNKKKTTTENSTSTQNTSGTSSIVKTNPAWAEDALKGFTGKVTGLMDHDPQDFVAGANPLQTQAGAAAARLGGWRAGLDEATGAARAAGAGTVDAGHTGRVSASSLLTGLDDYMNPVLDKVVNTTLTDFDVDAGRTRAAQAASAARNGAFGGSRYGVREAQTEGELSRARATTEAGLRADAFDRATGLSNSDAGRRQEADLANQNAEANDLARRVSSENLGLDRGLSSAGLMAQIAEAAGAGSRADVATQMDAGTTLRGIDTEQRQAPIGLLGAVGDLLGQGQFGLFNGANTSESATGTSTGTGKTVTTEDPGLMAKIGQAVQVAAQAAALAASDRRLKTEIRTEGHDDRGRRWVSWRYLWEPEGHPRHLGVIAQEIAQTDPEAVVEGPFGFLLVDYSKVEGGAWLHS